MPVEDADMSVLDLKSCPFFTQKEPEEAMAEDLETICSGYLANKKGCVFNSVDLNFCSTQRFLNLIFAKFCCCSKAVGALFLYSSLSCSLRDSLPLLRV